MSTRTTSARPASAIRWAVVAPTLPAPMTVTLFLGMGVGTSGGIDSGRVGRRQFYERDTSPGVEGGPNHRAGVIDVHALARAVRAAGPARVHEPGADAVPLEALREHRRIHARMTGHERRAEARRERRDRLLDPDLGAGELRGIA